jgi:hypothetical protein
MISLIKLASSTQDLLFMMVDSSDHITGKLALAPTVTLSKSGAAFAPPVGAITEVGYGWYKVASNVSDNNVLGSLILHAEAAGADPLDTIYEVVAYDPRDGIRLGLSALNAGNVIIAAPVVQAANKITVRAFDSWIIPISGLGNITSRTKLWFSVNTPGALDSAAKLFIEETAGLTVLNGAVYITPAHGSIVVDNATLGDITVAIEEAVTAQLSGPSNWTVKELTASGTAITLATGMFVIAKPGIEAIT